MAFLPWDGFIDVFMTPAEEKKAEVQEQRRHAKLHGDEHRCKRRVEALGGPFIDWMSAAIKCLREEAAVAPKGEMCPESTFDVDVTSYLERCPACDDVEAAPPAAPTAARKQRRCTRLVAEYVLYGTMPVSSGESESDEYDPTNSAAESGTDVSYVTDCADSDAGAGPEREGSDDPEAGEVPVEAGEGTEAGVGHVR